ncbi:MAG: hypothetical protein AAGE52_18275 [Myxococcota bacterium]
MLSRSVLSFLLLALSVGCGDSVPNLPDLPRDSSVECTASGTPTDGGTAQLCPSGEICLRGRCYAACDNNNQCGNRQICNDGVCVAGARGDAGVDAGFDAAPDPCEGVVCEGAEICHPSGECVQCLDRTSCDPANPICDLAFGVCQPFQPGLVCAPCGEDFDCDGDRTCQLLEEGERVCLAACSDEIPCARGFRCADDRCVPRLGTCTALRAGVNGRACRLDTDCVPLGVVPPPDICRGETVDTAGRCVQLCGTDEQCLDTFTCDVAAGNCNPI